MAAGERQPAVGSIGRTFCMACRKTLAVAFGEPRLAYASRSCCTTLVRREMISCNAESHTHQERRALARRGSVNRTLSGENRALFGDHATDEQERRPSARRGSEPHREPQSPTHPRRSTATQERGGRQPPWVQETHLQLVAKVAGWLLATVSPPWVRSVERSAWRAVNHLQSRFGNHGWLTPAAPGARRSFAGKSFLAMRSRTGTKSGGRKPPVAQNRIGNRNRPHTRPTEQPSVGSENALATSGEGCRMAAGERSPPWVGRWRVLRSVPRINVQLRLGNHGRLTPAAPAARRSFAGK
jgi:hypothetical protein